MPSRLSQLNKHGWLKVFRTASPRPDWWKLPAQTRESVLRLITRLLREQRNRRVSAAYCDQRTTKNFGGWISTFPAWERCVQGKRGNATIAAHGG